MAESFDPYRKWLGIPPEEQPPNHYRLLGVPLFEGDPDVIENAVHRQMSYVRTFQTGKHAVESQKILNELAAAKICLMSSSKKKAYDETLRKSAAGLPSVVPAPSPLPAAAEAPASAAPPIAASTAPIATVAESAAPTNRAAEKPPVATPAALSPMSPVSPPAPVAPLATPAVAPSTVPASKVPVAAVAAPAGIAATPARPPVVSAPSSKGHESPRFQGEPPPTIVDSRSGGKSTKPRDAKHKSKSATSGPPLVPKKMLVWVPVLTSLAGVVLVVVLATAYVAGNRSKGDGDAKGDGEASASELAGANPMFGKGGGRPKVATPPSDSPSKSTQPISLDDDSRAERTERVHSQLAALRESFGNRDLSRLRALAVNAPRAPRNSRLREEVEQTQVLGRYLDEFWKTAQRGVAKIERKLEPPEPDEEPTEKPTEKPAADAMPQSESKPEAPREKDPPEEPKIPAAEPDKRKKRPAGEEYESPVAVRLYEHVLEVVSVEDDTLNYRVNGEERRGTLRELPSLDAAAIAAFALKSDDLFGRVYVAAFLCIDKKGDRAENLDHARRIARDIEESNGAPFPYLTRELELASDGR